MTLFRFFFFVAIQCITEFQAAMCLFPLFMYECMNHHWMILFMLSRPAILHLLRRFFRLPKRRNY